MGVVQYHVWTLLRDGQIEDYRGGRYRRFFAAGVYGEMEQKVLSLMRQSTAGKVLELLAVDGQSQLTHTKIAEMLGITSQALTWQMGRLRAMGIVESSFVHRNGGMTYHLISDAEKLVQQHLKEVKTSLRQPLKEAHRKGWEEQSQMSQEIEDRINDEKDYQMRVKNIFMTVLTISIVGIIIGSFSVAIFYGVSWFPILVVLAGSGFLILSILFVIVRFVFLDSSVQRQFRLYEELTSRFIL